MLSIIAQKKVLKTSTIDDIIKPHLNNLRRFDSLNNGLVIGCNAWPTRRDKDRTTWATKLDTPAASAFSFSLVFAKTIVNEDLLHNEKRDVDKLLCSVL